MAKTTGWALRGQRLVDHAPYGHWRTQTFVAALRHDRLNAPWVIDGIMNRVTFDTYVETQLAPTLSKGDVIILNNLSSHKSVRAAEALHDVCAWVLFLPPYSPDLNMIEMAYQSSRHLSEKLPPELTTTSGTPLDTSATSSQTKNATTSSMPPDMEPNKRKTL